MNIYTNSNFYAYIKIHLIFPLDIITNALSFHIEIPNKFMKVSTLIISVLRLFYVKYRNVKYLVVFRISHTASRKCSYKTNNKWTGWTLIGIRVLDVRFFVESCNRISHEQRVAAGRFYCTIRVYCNLFAIRRRGNRGVAFVRVIFYEYLGTILSFVSQLTSSASTLSRCTRFCVI